jgi:hypothetical protein
MTKDEICFILPFWYMWLIKMLQQKKVTSRDFMALFDALWAQGPTVRYPNPDAGLRPH